MKPLAIDFAERPAASSRAGWWAGGVVAAVVLASGLAGLTSGTVEASHMAASSPHPAVTAAEAQAVDAAISLLNRPWLAVLDGVATALGSDQAVVLSSLEQDSDMQLRLTGESRDATAAQALPATLRAVPGIADVALVGQERIDGEVLRPIRFTLIVRLQEAA